MKTMLNGKPGKIALLSLTVLLVMGFTYRKGNNEKVFTGIASYYSNYYEGRVTSNGEIFRQSELTAASKDLKFGSIVKVTNLKNDSVVIVRINDRMPQTNKRLIDLSFRAATQLNMIKAGLANVRLEILNASPVIAKN